MSLFDKMWHPNLTEAEALVMMHKAIAEVKRRLVVAPPHFIIKVVDRDGVRTVKVV
jgi:20S proteasome subunit beta 4